jgi:uncharacterized cupredoxin-like copper-binding protein
MPTGLRVAGASLVLVLAAVGVGACSTSNPAVRATPVTVRNFAIDAPSTLKVGVVRFVISGRGPTMHELVVAATSDRATGLPVAADGTVDDKADSPGFHNLAEAEGIDIGDTMELSVTLEPGHYVLYCNMAGHYGAGMATDLTVTT